MSCLAKKCIDLVVLARYMQVFLWISSSSIRKKLSYSPFLLASVHWGEPHIRRLSVGKVDGATAHYVTRCSTMGRLSSRE